jgi:hypothetical protein
MFLATALAAAAAAATVLAAPAVAPAPAPSTTNSCVYPRDHGALGDGVSDDTAAIQAAVDTAVNATRPGTIRRGSGDQEDDTGPALCFGPGNYRVTSTIVLSPDFGWGPSGAPNVRGLGSPNVFLNSTTLDIFSASVQHWWSFSGMSLAGGRNQLMIGNNNSDQATMLVKECMFLESFGAAVHMLPPSRETATGLGPRRPGPAGCEGWPQGCGWRGSFSTQFTLRDSKFINCNQVLVNWGDWSTVSDIWVTTSPDMPENTAIFENWGECSAVHARNLDSVV